MEERPLVLSSYGVLTDAIKKRADDVYAFADYDSPAPNQPRDGKERQAVLASFLDLVKVSLDDDYRRDVRISRPRDALAAERRKRVDDLVRARLLSLSAAGGIEIVNIVHESLITNWDRLCDGVREERLTLQQRTRFEQQLSDWLASGRSADYLLTGVYLAQARELARMGDVAFGVENARKLLTQSEAAADAERQHELATTRRRMRVLATAFALVAVMAIAAIIALALAIGTANRNEALAEENANVAATAQAETRARSIAEANAIKQRDEALRQSRIAFPGFWCHSR